MLVNDSIWEEWGKEVKYLNKKIDVFLSEYNLFLWGFRSHLIEYKFGECRLSFIYEVDGYSKGKGKNLIDVNLVKLDGRVTRLSEAVQEIGSVPLYDLISRGAKKYTPPTETILKLVGVYLLNKNDCNELL